MTFQSKFFPWALPKKNADFPSSESGMTVAGGTRYQIFGQAWALTLALSILVGFAVVFAFGQSNGGVASSSSGILLGGACLLLGSLVGFLFAIPRYFSHDEHIKSDVSGGSYVVRYDPNDNLVQISDWLTKILVGVGLTQITSFPGFLDRFGTYFGPSLGANANALAIVIFLFFSVSGFLLGYLWTRIFFAGELYKADKENKETISRLVQMDKLVRIEKLSLLAAGAEQASDFRSAELYFKEIIQLDPNNIAAKASLADSYVSWEGTPRRSENLKEALRLCVEIEATGDLSSAQRGGILIIHATVNWELGEKDECVRQLNNAIKQFRKSGASNDRILSFVRSSKHLVQAAVADTQIKAVVEMLEKRI